MKTLAEQLAAAKANRAALEAAFTPADVEEETLRAQLASERKAADEAATRKRDLDIQRRLERAVGDGDADEFKAVVIRGWPDTFILRRNGNAHAKWERALQSAASTDRNKKVDKTASDRTYAVASVIDWNGETDFDATVKANGLTERLTAFLTANPGIVTPLNNNAGELNGVFTEERKS